MGLSKKAMLLRSRQLNPYDDLYWKSRGYPCRPDDWRDILGWNDYCDQDDNEYEDYNDYNDYDDDYNDYDGDYNDYDEDYNYCDKNDDDESYYNDDGYYENDDDYDYSDDDNYENNENEYYDDGYYGDDYEKYKSPRMKALESRSRQLNPCDILYWKSRGYSYRPHNWREIVYYNSFR